MSRKVLMPDSAEMPAPVSTAMDLTGVNNMFQDNVLIIQLTLTFNQSIFSKYYRELCLTELLFMLILAQDQLPYTEEIS